MIVRRAAIYALLFAVALVPRLIVVAETSDGAYHRYLVLDAATYQKIAVEGDPSGPFWQPPGYPWLLRAVYRLGRSEDPRLVRLLQAFAGAAAALLLALAGARLGRRRAGLAAGFAAALYGPLIYFDNELLPASPGVLVVALLMFLLCGAGPPGRRRTLAAGLTLGAGGVLLPPLALPGGLLCAWLGRRHGMRAAALFALAAALPVTAVAIRNARFDEGFVPVSYNGGVNFWIGNNPDYPATAGIRPGMAWNELTERPRCIGGARTLAAESSWFYGEALRFGLAHPLAWARLLAWKGAATLSVFEIGRNRNVYDAREESRLLRFLIWPWGFPFLLLGPLAAGAAVALARRRELPAAPALLAAGVLLGCVLFFPTARYRAPALPPLILIAALGAPRLRPRDLAAPALCLGLGLVPPGIPPIPRSETFYNIGMSLSTSGRPVEALRFFDRALALDPGNADVHWARAAALAKIGRDEEAKRELDLTLELAPEASLAWQALGAYHRRQADFDAARRALERAVELDGCNRRARALLAHTLLDLGLYRAARAEIDAAHEVYPRFDRAIDEVERRYARLTGARRSPDRPAE